MLFSVGISARTCAVTTTPCNPDNTAMKLSGITNAHGEIWSQTNYAQYLCCDFTTANPHTCSGNNKILKLSGITNAHAEIATGTAYSTDVCFGDLNCESATGSCSGNDAIALRLSDNTNAHIAGPLETAYSTLICCDFSSVGDGIISGLEECDDGNTDDGDGCSSTGTIESNWVCSGEPSVCTPDCTFTSSNWEATEVINGTIVELNVYGTGNCDGQNIIFNIGEVDIGNYYSSKDDLDTAKISVPQVSSQVLCSGGICTASASWIAEWILDENNFLGNDDPEYVFKASLEISPSVGIDNSGQLKVLPGAGFVAICPTGTTLCSRNEIDYCYPGDICPIGEAPIDDDDGVCEIGEGCTSSDCNDGDQDSCITGTTCQSGVCSGGEIIEPECTDGTTLCSNNGIDYCYPGNICPVGESPPTNNNGVCEIGEGCTSSDCSNGDQDSCITGATCQSGTCLGGGTCYFTSAEWSSSEVSVGTNVNLNVQGNGFCDGESVKFEVFENELIGRYPAQTNPVNAVFNGNSVTGTWIAEYTDDGFAQGEPEYVFKASLVSALYVEIDDSGELTILPDSGGGLECNNITSCSNYLTEGECDTDSCSVAEGSVEENNPLVSCGEEGVSCECVWVSDSCESSYTNVAGDYIVGTCSYDESTDDDCEDGFLSYSWTSSWIWGHDGWVNWTNSSISGSVIGDYELDNLIYYYDPYGKFNGCQDGSTIVECPVKIQVGFFGFWNFIIAVIILVGIYSFFERNKKF